MVRKKGKFIYVFGDGSILTDRNGYNTITQAKKWAKDHNSGATRKKDNKSV